MKSLEDKFMQLAKLEPKLLDLLNDIKAERRAAKGQRYSCANTLWYGNAGDYSFKDRLCELVGWGRGKSRKPKSKRIKASDVAEWFKPIPLSVLTEAPPPLPPGPLYTCEAYDVAYKYLYSHLPDCKRCGCFGVAA